MSSQGRNPQYGLVDGELVMVKQPVKVGNSLMMVLPAEWLELVRLPGEPTVFTLEFDADSLIIKPHYGEYEGGIKL